MKPIRHIFRDFVFLVIIFQLFVFRNDFERWITSLRGPWILGAILCCEPEREGGFELEGKLKQANPNRLDNISNRG